MQYNNIKVITSSKCKKKKLIRIFSSPEAPTFFLRILGLKGTQDKEIKIP